VQKRSQRRKNGLPLKSEAISQDIEALERDLASLRARVEGDSSNFATLEQQVAELRENLLRTRESVAEREARLADKRKEFEEAKRLEALAAYEGDLRSQREAADWAATAATDFLAAVDAYDDETLKVRRLLEEMREAFGSDERVAEVESAVQDEPSRLRGTWEAVIAATKWRLEPRVEEETVAGEELPQDLQDLAQQERRRARIKEYFAKS
jgi:predicted  nucleic acid-binding Zn-ribbon protein